MRASLKYGLLTATLLSAAALSGCTSPGDEGSSPTPEPGSIVATDLIQGGPSLKSIDAIPVLLDSGTTPPAGGPAVSTFFFLASSGDTPGLFSVPAEGGNPTEILLGAPLVNPTGVVVSSDLSTLFIADQEAGAGGLGAILTVNLADGQVTILVGSETLNPRGLDLVRDTDGDQLYFTGLSPSDHEEALMRIPAAGGTPIVLHRGLPLLSADAITVSGEGTVYVSDQEGGTGGTGRVYSFAGSQLETLVDAVKLGFPGGIALTREGGALLISSHAADSEADQVLIVDVLSKATSIFDDGISQNTHGAGLHRAFDQNVFAWADYQTDGNKGKVYKVTLY